MTPQETLNDLLIERQLKLLRLAKSREYVVVKLLRDYLADIEATIAKRRTPASETLTVIQDALRKLLAPFSDDVASALEFEKLAQVEAENAVSMLNKSIGAQIAVTVSAARVAEVAHKSVIAGLPISDWFQDYEDKLVQDISRAVRVGVAGGKTMREISQDLDALLPDVKESSVKTMARTLTFGLAANARQVVYDENTDIIQGWIQVSTLDSRTTLLCAARDNLAWDKDKQPVGHNQDFKYPPLHPNCRSIMSPWLYSSDDLPKDKRDKLTPSTRASMDGQVPASKTFEEFLTGKGATWQREYLGESRYNLWKSGKVKSLQDFITPDGRTIRLDDL